jgi:hypothetical protein
VDALSLTPLAPLACAPEAPACCAAALAHICRCLFWFGDGLGISLFPASTVQGVGTQKGTLPHSAVSFLLSAHSLPTTFFRGSG